jgi:hypothetical protein
MMTHEDRQVHLNVPMPESTRRRLKALCAQEGVTMIRKVLELIEKELRAKGWPADQ